MVENNLIINDKNSEVIKADDIHIGEFSIWDISKSKIQIGRNACLGPFQHIKLDNAILKIGSNVEIGGHCTISAKGNLDNKVVINIGDDVKIDEYCHLQCFANLNIGKRCHFWNGTYISPFKNPFSFDESVTFGQKVVIGGRGPLTVKRYSMIGGLSAIITENHNYKDFEKMVREQGFEAKGIFIGSDVWIGVSVIILDGAMIEDKTIIGAASLVKGKTEKGGIYYGIPIKKVGERTRGGN